MAELAPLGEAAFLARDLPAPAYVLAAALAESPFPGLIEAVPAYDTLGLYVDPDRFKPDLFLARLEVQEPPTGPTKTVEVQTTYDGPDFPEVCERLGIDSAEFIRLHSSVEYRCYAIGFCPGFPYLGYLDDHLVLPRKEQPLPRVPAGSVAIAGRQTGIYPLDRPGGWWLIGSTEAEIVDLAVPRFAIAAGDVVRFVPA